MPEEELNRPAGEVPADTAVAGSRASGAGNLIAGVVLVAVAAMWVVGFANLVVMPLVVLKGVERTVPDLRHMDWEAADSLCRALDLDLVRGRVRVDQDSPPGEVVDQTPQAGAVVKPGRHVEVVVSAAAGVVPCPDVRGRSPREAALEITAVGLACDQTHTGYRHSTSSPAGVVLGQIPPAGAPLQPGDTVRLTVSLGATPKKVVAPDLVGRKLEGIGLVLIKNSLRLGNVVHYPDRSVPTGTIISQDPPAGTGLKAGDRISLRVAATPEERRHTSGGEGG